MRAMKDLVSDSVTFELVRDFRPDVVRAFLQLGKKAHSESAHSHLVLDPGYLLENAQRFTHLDKHAFWLAWDGD